MTKRKLLTPIIILAMAVLLLLVSLLLAASRRVARNSTACTTQNFTGIFEEGSTIAYFEGQKIDVPQEVAQIGSRPVLGVAANGERYIEVDLSEQKLKAWDGQSLFFESAISSGLPWWPTPQGEFRIWAKLRYTRMQGGEGKYYYNLPNVPFVMYFSNDKIPGWRGYGLHGAYWHNDFGRVHSHGCVNLPISSSEKLYYWTTPTLPEGKSSVFASDDNPGTRIVIHE